MNGVYLDYDRAKYPDIASAEKRDMKTFGWPQEEVDRLRETISLKYYCGTREEKLQGYNEACRISYENGLSSMEWAKQQSAQESESNSSSIWIWCFFAIMLLIMGVIVYSYSEQPHISHRAVSFE